MIRPLTIATFLTACASGLYLYQAKHEAQVLDRTIEKTLHETAAYREQSRLLAAEWTMLNDPESLRRFSDTYLTLKTIAPSQFASLTDLDSRLPAVPIPAPKGDADAETGEPVAAVPEAAVLPSGGAENPSALVADDPGRGPAQPAAPSTAVSTHPAERKIVASQSSPAGAAYNLSATDAATASRAVAGSEPRPLNQHPAETRLADRHVAQPAETRASEPKTAEPRSPMPVAQPRPMVVAAASRPAATVPVVSPGAVEPSSASAATAVPAPVPVARGGSLLGMARGSAPSLPRPMPANATQWSNAN